MGYDGLAGGIGLTSMLLLGVVAQGNGLLGLVAFALVGALLGFLRYNFPPARIYLGDGGAYFLGFLIAALALANADRGLAFQTMGTTIVLLSVPLADAAFTVFAQRGSGVAAASSGSQAPASPSARAGRSRQEPLLWVYGLNLILLLLV